MLLCSLVPNPKILCSGIFLINALITFDILIKCIKVLDLLHVEHTYNHLLFIMLEVNLLKLFDVPWL